MLAGVLGRRQAGRVHCVEAVFRVEKCSGVLRPFGKWRDVPEERSPQPYSRENFQTSKLLQQKICHSRMTIYCPLLSPFICSLYSLTQEISNDWWPVENSNKTVSGDARAAPG